MVWWPLGSNWPWDGQSGLYHTQWLESGRINRDWLWNSGNSRKKRSKRSIPASANVHTRIPKEMWHFEHANLTYNTSIRFQKPDHVFHERLPLEDIVMTSRGKHDFELEELWSNGGYQSDRWVRSMGWNPGSTPVAYWRSHDVIKVVKIQWCVWDLPQDVELVAGQVPVDIIWCSMNPDTIEDVCVWHHQLGLACYITQFQGLNFILVLYII